MAYKAPIWEDGKSPAISAENLNNLSQAAEGAQVLYGNSAPTSSTEGAVGQFYLVVVADGYGNYPLYQCVAIANGSYTWNNMAIVPAKVAAAFNLPTGTVVSDVLLAAASPRLISSYEVAGSYQWIAPDLIDGKPYKIGVLIIGGGGSGACTYYTGSNGNYSGSVSDYALGGGSGYTKSLNLVVTPGLVKSVVVGLGGASVSSGGDGKSGGTSAFDGVIASGGGAGRRVTSNSNAERSSGSRGNGAYDDGTFGLEPTHFSSYYSSETPWQCFNPFEGKEILGSGAGVCVAEDTGTIKTFFGGKGPDGLGGGNGGSTGGEAATAPGCGGGGTIAGKNSGSGADGAVYIYFLGVADE